MVDTTQERKAAASLQEDEKPAPKATEPMHGQVIIEFVRKNEKPQVSFPFVGGIWQAEEDQKRFCGEAMAKQSAIDYAEELKGKGIAKINIQSFEITAQHREGAQGFPRAIWMENGHLCERMTGVSIITKPDGDELIPEKVQDVKPESVPERVQLLARNESNGVADHPVRQGASVPCCPRCGEAHDDVEIYPFINSQEGGPRSYAICPETNQPIIIKVQVIFE